MGGSRIRVELARDRRDRDRDGGDPAPNPVPDPPQKGNPEVVPGPNRKGKVVAVQNREDKFRATGASEIGGKLSPGFCKNRKSERLNLLLFVPPSPQFLDLPPPLQQ